MDHSKYEYTRKFVDGRPWHTDTRHINILHELAMALPSNGRIAEIGSCKGASTSAYVEAMLLRKDLTLTIYEIRPMPELLDVVNSAGDEVRSRITIIDRPAYAAMCAPSNLVFIDGDHKWPALADLAVCLATGCEVIAMHDTHGTGPKSRKLAHGAILAGEILRRDNRRYWWEDNEKRPGEYTDRGFLVSWPKESEWVVPCIPGWKASQTNMPLRNAG